MRAESSGNGAAANGSGKYDFDLFTIGAGSGGVRAARFAASTFGGQLSFLQALSLLVHTNTSVPCTEQIYIMPFQARSCHTDLHRIFVLCISCHGPA